MRIRHGAKVILTALICHWQTITPGPGPFKSWGPPQFGSTAELDEAERLARAEGKRVKSECVKPGEKTPSWLVPSGSTIFHLKGPEGK